ALGAKSDSPIFCCGNRLTRSWYLQTACGPNSTKATSTAHSKSSTAGNGASAACPLLRLTPRESTYDLRNASRSDLLALGRGHGSQARKRIIAWRVLRPPPRDHARNALKICCKFDVPESGRFQQRTNRILLPVADFEQ